MTVPAAKGQRPEAAGLGSVFWPAERRRIGGSLSATPIDPANLRGNVNRGRVPARRDPDKAR